MKTRRHVLNVLFAAFAGMAPVPWAAADEISSFAFAQADGSLKIAGYVIRLYVASTEFIFRRPTRPAIRLFGLCRAVQGRHWLWTSKSQAISFTAYPRARYPDGGIAASVVMIALAPACTLAIEGDMLPVLSARK